MATDQTESKQKQASNDWRAVRVAAGLSGAELAKRLNVSHRTLTRFEASDPAMGERFRNKLALAYRALAAEVAAINGVSGSTST